MKEGYEMDTIINNFSYTSEHWFFSLPLIFIAIDIVTGLTAAWLDKKITSVKMRQGLAKKVGEIAILIIGKVLYHAINLPYLAVLGFSFYIVLMELISICENLKKMGVPIPEFIKRSLVDAMNMGKGETK